MSNAFELAKKWDEAGELAVEFQALSAILHCKKFTREQIIDCFECIIGPLCVKAWKSLKHPPTIEEFRAEIHDYFSNTVQVIEVCMSIVDSGSRTELENLFDALRILENQDWVEGLDGQNPDAHSEED